jgi:hypothetical protein
MKPALTFELGASLKPFPCKTETENRRNFEDLRAFYLWVHDYINNSFRKKKVLMIVKEFDVSIVRTFDKLFLLLYFTARHVVALR